MRLGKRERAVARTKALLRAKARSMPDPVGRYATAWSRMRGAGKPAGIRGMSWRWDWRKAASVRRLNLKGNV